MVTENRLKPCPFCGSTNIEYDQYNLGPIDEIMGIQHVTGAFECFDCKTQGPDYRYDGELGQEHGKAGAADLWNTRIKSTTTALDHARQATVTVDRIDSLVSVLESTRDGFHEHTVNWYADQLRDMVSDLIEHTDAVLTEINNGQYTKPEPPKSYYMKENSDERKPK